MNTFRLLAAAAILAAGTSFASADPIEGNWKTGDDVLVKVSNCGGSFCVDVMDGEYKGKRSGKLASKGGNTYEGTLKQFSTGISCNGTPTVAGNSMKLVAKKFGMTVKTDNWKRQ